jgi:cobalamin-dependent methionine synthase I
LKKPAGSVRFRFYKPKTKKTEPNRTQIEKNHKKPNQIGLNRYYPKKPNRTETDQFEPVSVFFKKIDLIIFFLIKTELN